MNDFGGLLWVIIGMLGVGGLAAAITYAAATWRKRPESPEIESVKAQTTEKVYKEEEKETKRQKRR
jgi:threonine dehydratase